MCGRNTTERTKEVHYIDSQSPQTSRKGPNAVSYVNAPVSLTGLQVGDIESDPVASDVRPKPKRKSKTLEACQPLKPMPIDEASTASIVPDEERLSVIDEKITCRRDGRYRSPIRTGCILRLLRVKRSPVHDRHAGAGPDEDHLSAIDETSTAEGTSDIESTSEIDASLALDSEIDLLDDDHPSESFDPSLENIKLASSESHSSYPT